MRNLLFEVSAIDPANPGSPVVLRASTAFAEASGVNLDGKEWSPVLIGGPVQPERGFVLHSPTGNWESSFKISDRFCVTTSRDVLVAMAAGNGPENAIVTLGYSGWSQGQIETELKENAWLTVDSDERILFKTALESRWEAAAALVGVEDDLGQAVAVAQVDQDDAAVVAVVVDPAGELHRLLDVGRAELAASVGAVTGLDRFHGGWCLSRSQGEGGRGADRIRCGRAAAESAKGRQFPCF